MGRERRWRRRPMWFLGSAWLLASGCRSWTHADDWQVAPDRPTGPVEACAECGEDDRPGLRHVPCRPPAEYDGDDGQLHFHVLRSLRLSASPAEGATSSGADDVEAAVPLGLDMDCSERRPSGRPTACRPQPEASLLPWSPAPLGIDNALGERLFGALRRSAGEALDVEGAVNSGVARGSGTITMSIHHWNGTPNDTQVGFTLAASPGPSASTTPPKWTGEDQWDVMAGGEHPDFPGLGVPSVRFTTEHAYVRDGILVADLRSIEERPVTLFNGGAKLEVILHDLVVTARIDGYVLEDAVVTGRLWLDELLPMSSKIADFLAGCDTAIAAELRPRVPALLRAAADLPLRGHRGSEPCAAISVAYGGRAPRAVIGQFVALAQARAECP